MRDSDVVVPIGFEATYARWHYAAAARAGNLLFVSGDIGVDADGKVPADPETQFAYAFESIGRTLQTAGGSFADVVDITSYHIDWTVHRDAFVAVKDRYLEAPYPAWTAIGIAELGLPGALVEIRVVANLSH